jgi:MFS family permease
MSTAYNKTCVFTAACAGLAFFGITMLALGPLLSHLGAGANALPATLSVGIILGTLIFGPVTDHFGYKGLLIAGALSALCGMQGLAHLTAMPLLHGSMMLLGIGGGILNGETNALVSNLYDDRQRGGRLSILGACYCVGALLWTSLNYFIPNDYTVPLHIVSAIMAGFAVFFAVIRFPLPKSAAPVSVSGVWGLVKSPALLLFAFLLFFQSGFESVADSFTVRFLEGAHGMALEEATLSLTYLTIGMLIGRMPLGFSMKRLGDSRTLLLYLGIALSGVAWLHFSVSMLGIYLAAALIGWGVGATYPVVFNYLGRTFTHLSGTAFSIAIFIGLFGQFIFTKGMGIWFDRAQFEVFPVALAFAVGMMMILLPVAVRFFRKMVKPKK